MGNIKQFYPASAVDEGTPEVIVGGDVNTDQFFSGGLSLRLRKGELNEELNVGDVIEIDVDGVLTEYTILADNGDNYTLENFATLEEATDAVNVIKVDDAVDIEIPAIPAVFEGASSNVLVTDNDETRTGQKNVIYMHIDDYEDEGFTPVETTLYLLHDS